METSSPHVFYYSLSLLFIYFNRLIHPGKAAGTEKEWGRNKDILLPALFKEAYKIKGL